MKRAVLLIAALVVAAGPSLAPVHTQSPGAGEARLLRFPAIHGNQVVFTYAGDLYTVPAAGGIARRLTSDAGFEMFARFSPDGKSIAFTGQYDGNTEVYLMAAEGGIPRRLTYTATLGRDDVSDRMGPNNIVIGWKNEKQILFRSRRTEWNDFRGQLYLASVDGGPIEELPLPRGGFGSFSPDGRQFVYNRVFREFRTWKRYRGGQADEVWLHDFATKTTTNLTSNPAQDIIPMWKGSKVYFASDRDERGRMNLYSYDTASKQTKKLTAYTEFDVKFPSLGDGAIVFENGGWIYKLDLASEQAVKVPVRILEDLDGGRGAIVDVSRSITNYEIAPDGSRALFGARGDVFTVPAKFGATRNLTRTPGVHERNSKWSPDGRWIAYISDASGEDEIWIAPQDGRGAATQVTTGGSNYKYQPVWSPDSQKLLWSDRQQRLHVVDIGTKAAAQIADAQAFEITSYSWSPDSRWVAYAKPEVEGPQRIYLYALDTKQTIPASDAWFNSSEPVFSSDGTLLFFVSARSFNPTYGQTEFQHVYTDMSRIYFVTLAKDTKHPFAPRSDEVKIKDAPKPAGGDAKAPEAKKADAAPAVRVDADGLIARIGVIPTPPANYASLTSVGSRLYYGRASAREAAALYVYDLEKQTETQIGAGTGYEISADGKKMLIGQSGNRYAIIDIPAGKAEPRDFLDLTDMKVALDRRAEWRQMFNESWRQMRDFFYAPNMHGVDWPAMRRTYEVLVPHVTHRADLTYVIGEMIAELSAGHAYVGGGDLPRLERTPMGLLGAQLQRDPQSKYFRITKIFKGQNWEPSRRSPLSEIGVNAGVGDYILEVDGRSTAGMTDIWEALAGRAGKQVSLRSLRHAAAVLGLKVGAHHLQCDPGKVAASGNGVSVWGRRVARC
ncbi:MAG: PDZ domain-containing protein [Vicinamibacterales bacterium]